MDANTALTTALLKEVMKTVRQHTTPQQRSATWVYRFDLSRRGSATYEFHGPDKFYWHGSAYDAYEAKYKGWSAWLESKGIQQSEDV